MNALLIIAIVYFSGVISLWVVAFLIVNFSKDSSNDDVTVGDVLPISFLSWVAVIFSLWYFVDKWYNHVKDVPLLIKNPKSKIQTDTDWYLEKVRDSN